MYTRAPRTAARKAIPLYPIVSLNKLEVLTLNFLELRIALRKEEQITQTDRRTRCLNCSMSSEELLERRLPREVSAGGRIGCLSKAELLWACLIMAEAFSRSGMAVEERCRSFEKLTAAGLELFGLVLYWLLSSSLSFESYASLELCLICSFSRFLFESKNLPEG